MSIAAQQAALSKYFPGGRVFGKKAIKGSNFYKFLTGIATELTRVAELIDAFDSNILPDTTVLLIDEWEKAVGIPDTCFFGTGPLPERRDHVLVKLASLGVQTTQDFIDLAALFGVVATVVAGASKFNITVTLTLTTSNTFPMIFPFQFGDPLQSIIPCLFNKLKPANCDVTFIAV